MATNQTIADFIKQNPGYTAGWNKDTKTSTITDNSGNTVSFTSGQANNDLGVTGQIQNGSNVVDVAKLQAALQAQAKQKQQAAGPSPTDMINQQALEQQRAQAAAIMAARDKQVADYNAQIAATPQTYDPLRNQASYQGAKNLMAAKEAMAAQGLQNSGDNVSTQVKVNTATQNNINGLNQQEQNLVNQLKKAISDANASADVQTIQSNAQINAQKLQQLLQQQNADRDYNLNVAGLTGSYNGQRTIQGQQLDNSVKQQNLDNQYRTDTFNYQKDRDKVADSQWTKQFNEGVRQFEKQFNESQRQWNAEFAFDQRKQSFAERQAQVQNAIEQGRLSIQQGQLQLDRDQYAAENDPNSLDNRIKLNNAGMIATKNKDGTYSYSKDPNVSAQTNYNYKTDSDWADDYSSVISNPSAYLGYLQSNAQVFIQKYGVDGYNALLSKAQQGG